MMKCSQSACPWQLIKKSKLRRKSQVGAVSILERDSYQDPAINTSTLCLKIMQTIWRMCETPSTPPWRVVWCLGAETKKTNMKCPPDRPSFWEARSTKCSSQRLTIHPSNSRAFQTGSSLFEMWELCVTNAVKWSHSLWRDSKRLTKKSLSVCAKTRLKSIKSTQKTCGNSTPQECNNNSRARVPASTCTCQTNTKTFSPGMTARRANLAQDRAFQPRSAFMTAQLPCIDKKIERQAWRAPGFRQERLVSNSFA